MVPCWPSLLTSTRRLTRVSCSLWSSSATLSRQYLLPTGSTGGPKLCLVSRFNHWTTECKMQNAESDHDELQPRSSSLSASKLQLGLLRPSPQSLVMKTGEVASSCEEPLGTRLL